MGGDQRGPVPLRLGKGTKAKGGPETESLRLFAVFPRQACSGSSRPRRGRVRATLR